MRKLEGQGGKKNKKEKKMKRNMKIKRENNVPLVDLGVPKALPMAAYVENIMCEKRKRGRGVEIPG